MPNWAASPLSQAQLEYACVIKSSPSLATIGRGLATTESCGRIVTCTARRFVCRALDAWVSISCAVMCEEYILILCDFFLRKVGLAIHDALVAHGHAESLMAVKMNMSVTDEQIARRRDSALRRAEKRRQAKSVLQAASDKEKRRSSAGEASIRARDTVENDDAADSIKAKVAKLSHHQGRGGGGVRKRSEKDRTRGQEGCLSIVTMHPESQSSCQEEGGKMSTDRVRSKETQNAAVGELRAKVVRTGPRLLRTEWQCAKEGGGCGMWKPTAAFSGKKDFSTNQV
eukprot:SAG31_NODE_5943_length_2247_cov_1.319367_2_plen_285_part_00